MSVMADLEKTAHELYNTQAQEDVVTFLGTGKIGIPAISVLFCP